MANIPVSLETETLSDIEEIVRRRVIQGKKSSRSGIVQEALKPFIAKEKKRWAEEQSAQSQAS